MDEKAPVFWKGGGRERSCVKRREEKWKKGNGKKKGMEKEKEK